MDAFRQLDCNCS